MRGRPASFAQILKGVGKTASVYTVGVFTVRFAEFLLVPIYWRFLDPADYGVLAATGIVSTFIATAFGLGLQESITRFYHSWSPAEKRLRLGAIWMMDWGSSLALGIPLALFGGPLVGGLMRQVEFDPYLRLGVLIGMFGSLSLSPLSLLRVSERPGLYVLCSLLSFAANVSLALLALVVWRQGVLGLLEAQVLSGIVMAGVYGAVMRSRAVPNIRTDRFSGVLRYSLPLVPVAILESLAWLVDRFVLEKTVSLAELGIYAAAMTLCAPLRLLQVALKTTWVPFQMRMVSEQPEAPRIIARMASYFAFAVLLGAVGLAVAIRDLVHFLGNPKYVSVADYVPFALVPHAVGAITVFLGGGLAIARKTKFSWIVAAACIVSLVVGSVTLIPLLGLYGAILATTLGFVIRGVVLYVLSQRYYYIPFEWMKLWLMTGAGVLTYALASAVPMDPSLGALAFRLVVVGVYAGTGLYVLLDGQMRHLRHLGIFPGRRRG